MQNPPFEKYEELEKHAQFVEWFADEFEEHPLKEPYDGYEENIIGILKAAQALLTLLRAIEEGRWAIVPCEATDVAETKTATDEIKCDCGRRHKVIVESHTNYGCKAAPQDEIMRELFGGCDDLEN